jgi:hypothetical protein
MTDSPLVQDAPDLIGVGAQSIVDNADRLGLTWNLRPATVKSDGTLPQVGATYDGDSDAISMVNMSGRAYHPGDRVYGIAVPPSGNFIAGPVSLFGQYIDANFCNAGGVLATSVVANVEVAVPGGSWGREPTYVFQAGRCYLITINCAPNCANAGSSWGFMQVRMGSGSATGTGLLRHYVQYPPNFAGLGKSEIGHGWVFNSSGSDISTKLSLTTTWVASPVAPNNGLGIYGGDALAPTYIAVYELPTLAADNLRSMCVQI